MQGSALVTGASAGIGEALAREFARNGHDVVLVARREERLRDIAADLASDHGVEAHVVVQDLATPDGPDELYAAVSERGLGVSALVNNVGVGIQGRVTDVPWERDLTQLRLNVVVPTHLTKRFGADMVERGEGWILNVASTAAFQPGPFMAVYYATKAYLLSFSEAVAEELRPAGVRVSALCPGPVSTEFQERSDNTDAPIGTEGAGPVRWQEADAVARAGYEGLAAGEVVVVPGLDYRALDVLARLLPRPVSRKLAKRLNAAEGR